LLLVDYKAVVVVCWRVFLFGLNVVCMDVCCVDVVAIVYVVVGCYFIAIC
jgi:hypothetical protein